VWPVRLAKLGGWLLAMAALGVALGAVQLIPLVELLPLNFRAGSASLDQVRAWAWPSRHVLSFWLPNIFGSPSHHAVVRHLGAAVDVPAAPSTRWANQARTIFWGIKNYVEGANYLGVATWLLAGIAVLGGSSLIVKVNCVNENRKAIQAMTQRIYDQDYNYQSPERRHNFPSTWLFAALAGPLTAVCVWHAALCDPLLWAAGVEPTAQPVPLGLPVYAEHGAAGRGLGWIGCSTRGKALTQRAKAQRRDGRFARGRGRRGFIYARPHCHLVALALARSRCATAAAWLLRSCSSLPASLAPGPFVAFGQRIVDGSDLAQMAFASGAACSGATRRPTWRRFGACLRCWGA
jgi:hypothetical protein